MVHMAAPDHWVTLAVLGRSRKWDKSKVFRTSLITAIGHVLLSLAFGVGVAAVGIVFSTLLSGYLDAGIGIVMIVVGLIVGIRPLLKRVDAHHDHEHPHSHDHDHDHPHQHSGNSLSSNIGYFAVLGAALSPDPSIVPIFVASIPAGFYFLAELAAIFAVTSILTLVVLVQLGSRGFAKALERIPEKYNDSIVGFVIAAIGIFVLVAGH